MGRTLKGTISSSITYNSKVLINDDLTINSGVVLTLNTDTVIKVAQGKKIYCYGTMTAAGASGNRMTITSEISGNKWNGILFSGARASGSSISYTNIYNVQASYGYAVQFYNVSANPADYTPGMMYCDISNNSTSTTGGVCFYNSSGYLCRNKINSNSFAGVYCYIYSSPQ
jgi:hypothetical protein